MEAIEALKAVHETVGESTRDLIWYNKEIDITDEFTEPYMFIDRGVSGYIGPVLMPVITNSRELWMR